MTLPPNTVATTRPSDTTRGYVCTLLCTEGDPAAPDRPMWIGVGISEAAAVRAALAHHSARPVAVPEGEGEHA